MDWHAKLPVVKLFGDLHNIGNPDCEHEMVFFSSPEMLDVKNGSHIRDSEASSIFSFGVLLATLLSGEHPFATGYRHFGSSPTNEKGASISEVTTLRSRLLQTYQAASESTVAKPTNLPSSSSASSTEADLHDLLKGMLSCRAEQRCSTCCLLY